MRFHVISDGQTDPGTLGISFARDLSELRSASVRLIAVPWSARGLEQRQLDGDAAPGLSHRDAVHLLPCSPAVDLDAGLLHLPSRVCSVPSSQGIDFTHSRRRC